MGKRLRHELFVSRLSFYSTKDGLRKLFSRFGAVKEDPRNGRPKGYGFVSYDSEAEAQKALTGLNGRIIDGRLLFVEFAKKCEQEPQKDHK